MSTQLANPATVSLADMASSAKADRNRAVDLYRAVAMLAVAIGHWAAIAVSLDSAGEIQAGNVLELVPEMSWVTWLLQVMPLFFVVGGFSSAMSLDSHLNPKDGGPAGRPQDWIVARMRRMVAPAIVLAATWVVALAIGTVSGFGALVAAGATAAAIPLWFLANYTIDTALAPYVLPRFRKNPVAVAMVLGGLFAALEALRFAHHAGVAGLEGFHHLAHINWVTGWLIFQVAGFAWRDGLLPTGGRLVAVATAFWTAAVAAVTVGPYPMAMVHFPGLDLSPTHPPSLALLLFGMAYSATALAAAPAVSNFLARSKRSWAAVVAANSVAMSIYLWHMTAAVIAGATFYAFGALPTADAGTAAWWLQKLPMMGLSAVVLGVIVALVAKVERRALLAERTPWNGGQASMLLAAAGVSVAFKLWTLGNVTGVAVGAVLLLALWYGSVADRSPARGA